MQELAQFFEEAIAEAGMDVTVNERMVGSAKQSEFVVSKRIGDRKLSYKVAVANPSDNNIQSIQKNLAQRAESVVNIFKEEITTRYSIGRREISVTPYDGGWAECKICGESVEAPRASYMVSGKELSTPKPIMREMSHAVSEMSDTQLIAFKLYLVGLLQRSCDHTCPNSKYTDPMMTERFK